VATPRFSMEPRQWCYPVIGCASYRGYFSRESADGFAADLRREGLDVAVEPVPAYSTLGWFDDPLPSTVIGWPEGDLAGLIFHELAHQRLYLPDDSAFNEAFATAVQRIGTERWFQARNDRAGLRQWRQAQRRERQFVHLILQTRKRLQALYARTLPAEEMARKKAAAFRQLQREYVAMRKGWGTAPAFDGWMGRNLNNAHLALIATYEEWVPAFRELLARAGGDLPEFYRQAEILTHLSSEQRIRRLQELRVAARQRSSVN
jgi:predicted aminopeptidase